MSSWQVTMSKARKAEADKDKKALVICGIYYPHQGRSEYEVIGPSTGLDVLINALKRIRDDEKETT